MRQVAYKTWAQGRLARKNSPSTAPSAVFPRKTRPARLKTPIVGCFEPAGRTFSRSRPPSDQAGRTFSRTRRNNIATLKPTTPLLTLNKGPLKPASPLHPKTAPKTPILHPQRRRRFQSRLGRRPQRRCRFQLRLGLCPQRRQEFQTSGPPGRQGLAAVPTGSNDTTAPQISHVIYRGHFSRHSKNVAIPTMQIQCLNKSQGNYVRN